MQTPVPARASGQLACATFDISCLPLSQKRNCYLRKKDPVSGDLTGVPQVLPLFRDLEH